MHTFGDLMPLEEALRRALEAARPVDRVEKVLLDQGVGRVLAEAIVSPIDVPAFDKAMMDGYSFRAQDVPPEGSALEVAGEAHPGEPYQRTLEPGRTVKTATGAPVPAGADAVVEVELVEVEDAKIRVPGGLTAGRNISPLGEDIGVGDALLPAGTLLQPGHVGAVAAVGLQELPVTVRPAVAVFATGREIKRGGQLQPGEIYDVNSFTLAGLIRQHGASVEMFDPILDTFEDIREAVARAAEYDAVVLSGSTSVGERDFLRDAVADLGEVLFHGLAVRPGKPVLMGRVQGGLVFGMPGFPASALMAGYHILVPVLRRLGRLPEERPTREAVLGEDLPANQKKAQLVTVRLEGGKAYPAFRESGSITSVSRGDGYVVVPPGEKWSVGDRVEAVLF